MADQQLNQCLKLLQGPSDEERFVGLVLITKVVESPDPATLRLVLDAVGDQFLDRLLLTKGDYTTFGLNLLCTLCSAPEIACIEGMPQRIIPVVSLLDAATPDELACDILETAAALCSSTEAVGLLWGAPQFARLLDFARGAQATEKSFGLVLAVLCQMAAVLFEQEPVSPTAVLSLVPAAAAILCRSKDQPKLASLELLGSALELTALAADAKLEQLMPSWARGTQPSVLMDLRGGLQHLLTSRLGAPERLQALTLLGAALRVSADHEWSLTEHAELSRGKFAVLGLQLAGVEAQLILGQYDEQGNAPNCALLGVCCRLLEHSIGLLIHEEAGWSAMPAEMVLQTGDVYNRVLAAVCLQPCANVLSVCGRRVTIWRRLRAVAWTGQLPHQLFCHLGC